MLPKINTAFLSPGPTAFHCGVLRGTRNGTFSREALCKMELSYCLLVGRQIIQMTLLVCLGREGIYCAWVALHVKARQTH